MADGKHFVNESTKLVLESLEGLTLTYPHIALDHKHKVVYVKDVNQVREQQVTLLSGGGAGHEPAHAGYVGPAMLTAAVSGHVFASPTSSQVLACIRRIYSPNHGTLVIVKNYTGDILNFGRAIERFKAERMESSGGSKGQSPPQIEMIVVDDDVGVIDEDDDDKGGVGRRGLAATVLVHKVCGALAATGSCLEEIKRIAKFVVKNSFTIGCALESASVPGGHGKPRQLPSDQLEIGMGIHNEPGFGKGTLKPAHCLIADLVKHMVTSKPWSEIQTREKHSDIVLLANNLGAVSNLEMGLVANEAVKSFSSHHAIKCTRVYTGTYMTGLAMAGISLTALVLPNDVPFRELVLDALDKPAQAPGWVNHPVVKSDDASDQASDAQAETFNADPKDSSSTFKSEWTKVIESGYQSVVKNEPTITRLDTEMGDGDCGEVLLAGATAIHNALESGELYTGGNIWTTIRQISCLVEDSMGGTSGIIYCLFLDGLAQSLASASEGSPVSAESATRLWSEAHPHALQTLYKYTSARPGHRTLIDSLEPFVATFKSTGGDLELSVQKALEGSRETANMKPKRGRAVYTGSNEKSLMDAGAVGLCAVLQGILEGLQQ
ncbi:Dihydroxyacetone kinase 2 [Mycoemilia scoparia]|uniref:Dihydroxyacetone kinase 2 n=1 Tax=Mycoemilia scoparia TaxID=417184 RepID=A0A9W8A3H0_9FUNG|nr:Dihydroxyacetone kinase 2 [Mycoemilia scoparia]